MGSALRLSRALALISTVVAVAAPWSWGQCLAQQVTAPGVQQSGYGVSVGIAGDTAAVGASGGGAFGDAGVVFLYERSGGVWLPDAVVVPGDGEEGDSFGRHIAIGGGTLAVASVGDDDFGPNSGSIYVFSRIGGLWVQEAKLFASDQEPGDFFGRSLDLSGSYLIAGAPWDDSAGLDAGTAYVFERDSGGWVQAAKLHAVDTEDKDHFGSQVAIDGTTAVVGAPQAAEPWVSSGAGYVFERIDGVWTQTAKLVPSGAGPIDRFGDAVAVSGNLIALGSFLDGGSVGSVYLYEKLGGVWTEVAKLVASDGVSQNEFGQTLAIDGETVIVGSESHVPGLPNGSIYFFERVDGQWTETAKVESPFTVHTGFGTHSLSAADGMTITGATLDDTMGADFGAAYLVSSPSSPCPGLYADRLYVKASTGGKQNFSLAPGEAFAGQVYFLLGSMSGTEPGTPVGSLDLPLTLDPYLFLTANQPNMPPLESSLGFLDFAAQATASLTAPPGTDPSLVGAAFYHAFLTFSPSAGVTSTSNPVVLLVLP